MKKAALLLAAILLLMHPAAAACLVTGEAYGVGAAAAIVMEAESGEVLFAQEIHRQLPMASTTDHDRPADSGAAQSAAGIYCG